MPTKPVFVDAAFSMKIICIIIQLTGGGGFGCEWGRVEVMECLSINSYVTEIHS